MPRQRRYEHWTLAAVLLLPFLLVYGKYLIGWAPSGGDIVNQYLPYQQMIRDQIHAGHMPFWNPWTFSGRPLLSDIQNGVFYPPNWLHWLLALPLSFALLLAGHALVMMLGCWRLGRYWDLKPAAIALGTVLWCFNPFLTLKPSQGVVLFIYTATWWPWMLLTMLQWRERGTAWALLKCSLVLTLSVLSGAPQLACYGWILTLIVGLAIPLPTQADRANTVKSGLRRIAMVALPFLAALGLTAIQTIPTVRFIAHSFERSGGAPWEYITDGSLKPSLLLQLIHPGFFGPGTEPGLYWGDLTNFAETLFRPPLWILCSMLPFGIFLLLRKNHPGQTAKPNKPILAWALLACVLGLLLALGKFSPVFSLFYHFVPTFDRFRVPVRLVLFFILGQAVIAAFVYDYILRTAEASSRRWLVWLACLVLALGLLVGLVLARWQIWRTFNNPFLFSPNTSLIASIDGMIVRETWILGALICIALSCLMLHDRFRSTRPALRWALPVLAGLQLAWFALPYNPATPVSDFKQEHYPTTPLVEKIKETTREGRILWLDGLLDWHYDQNSTEIFPNRPAMHGMLDTRGYDPVNASWYGRWMNLLGNLNPQENPGGFMRLVRLAQPRWLRPMGVETVLSYSDLSSIPQLELVDEMRFPKEALPMQPPPPSDQKDVLKIWRNKDFKGLAYGVGMDQLVQIPATKGVGHETMLAYAYERTRSGEPFLTTSMTRALDQNYSYDEDRHFTVASPPGPPHRREWEVDFSEAGMLVIATSTYPGWWAMVDGEYTAITELCGIWQGVQVKPGKHHVTLEYRPEGYTLGWILSLCSLVALGYACLRERIRRSDFVNTKSDRL